MAALVRVAILVTLVKLVLDVSVKAKVLKSDGFNYFRAHWLGYMGAGLMRSLFIGFFVMITLSLYQLSLRGRAGPTALASVVLVILSLGLGSIAGYACFFRLRHGKYAVGPDTLRCEQGKLFKIETSGSKVLADLCNYHRNMVHCLSRVLENSPSRFVHSLERPWRQWAQEEPTPIQI